MLNFEEDFTPAAKPLDVPSFLRKESAAPVGADVVADRPRARRPAACRPPTSASSTARRM